MGSHWWTRFAPQPQVWGRTCQTRFSGLLRAPGGPTGLGSRAPSMSTSVKIVIFIVKNGAVTSKRQAAVQKPQLAAAPGARAPLPARGGRVPARQEAFPSLGRPDCRPLWTPRCVGFSLGLGTWPAGRARLLWVGQRSLLGDTASIGGSLSFDP